MSAGDSETSVQVAVRVRPQNSREQIDMCRVCTFCTPDQPHIILGKDKAFTYDYVFDTATEQVNLYSDCVDDLVEGCFEGYNATVLAYGQTGSGKTYTMGSGFDMTGLPEEVGVIPRAVNQIFTGIEERKNAALEKNEAPPQFEIIAQFLELYNEEIIDLFDANKEQFKKLRIHEDPGANIYVAGASEVKVSSDEETIGCLKRGALLRSVGSTNMNAQSSRSHAIFTLHITQQRPCKTMSQGSSSSNEQEGEGLELSQQSSSSGESTDWETLKAKLHFVDLAGSERLKRTGATGERAKEGISINCGLLALGNVISALGDKAKRGSHVPYRDSKLTRLLQDSLGGNSRTLMIACVSPTDRDFMETLNTLKYANRARNIKNKVVVNQDKTSQQLSILRTRIQELELELQEFKSGRMVVSEDGSVVVNDMTNEITMLRTENDKLRMRVKAMQQVIDTQSNRIAALAAEKELAAMGHQDESTGQVLGQSNTGEDAEEQRLSTVIQGYMSQIEELKSRLVMSESLAHQSPQSPFRRAPSMVKGRSGSVSTLPFNQETEDLLEVARTNIQRLREKEDKKVSQVDLHASASQAPSSAKFKRQQSRELLNEGTSGHDQEPLPRDGERKISTESGSDEESSNEDLSEEGFDDSDEAILGDSSDDTDSDGDETESLASSIAELSSEINIKQQLVEQLEKAQKNLFSMKTQYEEKMLFLQQQIKSIESERDKVLKEIVSRRGAERNDEKVKEVKSKYQRDLDQLKAELKSLKAIRKEHAKAMKKNALHEKELKKLKDELLEMKKYRVKMMNKMREEASQKKVDDVRKAKEIAQLRKETRKKDSKIQALQTESRRREAVLKRKQEEISVLRRHNRYHPSGHRDSNTSTAASSSAVASNSTLPHNDSSNISTTVLSSTTSGSGSSYSATVVFRQQHPMAQLSGSGRSHRPLGRRMSSVFSSDNAKKKWRELERKILDAINKRQTMSSIAKDMDHWIKKRDELSRKVDNLKRQKDEIIKSTGKPIDISELSSINEDLDSVTAHVEYVQENIVELQNDLITLDDAKSDGDTIEAHAIITSSSPREAKYLLEHLLDMVLNLGVKAGTKESEVKSLRARLKASEQSAEIMKSLSSPQVSHPLVVNSRTVTKSKGPLHSSSTPTLSQKDTTPVPKLNLDDDADSAVQTGKSDNNTKASNIPQLKKAQPAGSGTSDKETTKWRRRTALPSEVAAGTITNNPPSSTATGGAGVSKTLVKERIRQFSDDSSFGDTSTTSKTDAESTDGEGGESVRLRTGSGGRLERRKGLRKKAASSLEVPTLSSGGTSCPTSPSISQRLLKSSASETNVWARLANTSSTQDGGSSDTRGSLQAERQDLRRMSTKLLTCTHTACGHSASVLSVHATQNLLFSASQDRTVKVWNLKTGTELLTLDKHFSYVRCVRFSPKNSLIFTASQSLIKIWDMRHHRARCIKTFGPPPGSGPSSSETVVQDLVVSSDGETLYSAAGHFVNIWDLKKFSYRGRLVGHNGAVSALALKKNIMATGSRDRLIKLYELDATEVVGNSPVSQPSVCTLYPPHYDAVSSFGVHGDLLFSSCGVTIKQWDMRERSLKQAVDGAHPQGNTINSLATLNSPFMPLLVSGCKGGLLKLWSPDSCGNIGEVVAHKNSINAIATNDTCIFTGSSDKTIRVWRPCPQDS